MEIMAFLWQDFNTRTDSVGHILSIINTVIMTIFASLYIYQNVFIIIAIFSKGKRFREAKTDHNYAYIIAARNEANVIGFLIDSIYKQNYPREKMQVFVIADNCTDNTAAIARSHEAIVYERFNQKEKGKSYALKYLFEKLLVDYPNIEACIVFDADNLVDENFTKEINKVYDSGYNVVTSYRNSKNFSTNYLTSGSGFCYLRECTLLHKARTILGLSTYISGTGFLVDYNIIKKQGGWAQHLMIEDLQFSADMILSGEKIMYAHDAIFYDEQPGKLKNSWNQRMRWVKGLYQCFDAYTIKILKAIFTRKRKRKYNRFELFEIGLFFTPTPGIALLWMLMYNLLMGHNLLMGNIDFNYMLNTSIKAFIIFLLFFFIGGAFMCLLLVLVDHKRIPCSFPKQIWYCITFIIFLAIYAPIFFIAPFKKVEWKVINHTDSVSIDKLKKKRLRY